MIAGREAASGARPAADPATPSGFASTAVVSLTRGLSLVLNMAVGVLSAAYFGAGAAKDCYVAAQTLPSLLGTVLMSGVYGTVLLALAETGAREGVAGQRRLARRTLLQLGGVLLPVCLLVTAFPGPITRVVAPGFGPDMQELSGRLLSLALFSTAGVVGFAVLRALYNARHQFALPGFVNLLTGAVSLVTLVLLVERAGIYALAIGPLIGAGLSLLVIGIAAFRTLKDPPGFAPSLNDSRPDLARGLWRDLLPVSVGANFGQVNLLVDNVFASYLPTGSVTRLAFATVIFANAELLTIFALAEVAFPRFLAAGSKGAAALQEELHLHLRHMLLLAAPIAAGCLVFGAPLARLLFERGAFGPDSTAEVARILFCLGPEIVFAGYFACFWRILFARRRMRALVWSSLGAMGLNAALNAALMARFGASGIALSTTFVTAVFSLVLGTLARREGVRAFAPGDRVLVLKILAGAAIMGAIVILWSAAFERTFDLASEMARLAQVGGGLILAAFAYAVALRVMGVRLVTEALDRFGRLVKGWRRG